MDAKSTPRDNETSAGRGARSLASQGCCAHRHRSRRRRPKNVAISPRPKKLRSKKSFLIFFVL